MAMARREFSFELNGKQGVCLKLLGSWKDGDTVDTWRFFICRE